MDPRSILVGKTYRTSEGELRRVTAMNDAQVTYTATVAPAGPGMIASSAPKQAPLDRFAAEMESELE